MNCKDHLAQNAYGTFWKQTCGKFGNQHPIWPPSTLYGRHSFGSTSVFFSLSGFQSILRTRFQFCKKIWEPAPKLAVMTISCDLKNKNKEKNYLNNHVDARKVKLKLHMELTRDKMFQVCKKLLKTRTIYRSQDHVFYRPVNNSGFFFSLDFFKCTVSICQTKFFSHLRFPKIADFFSLWHWQIKRHTYRKQTTGTIDFSVFKVHIKTKNWFRKEKLISWLVQ